MKDAPIFGKGNYMGEGVYRVELTAVFVKPRWKGGNVFVAEFKILESSNPKHAAGSTGSWVPKIETPNTFGDIKSLMFAALGINPKSVAPDDEKAHNQASLLAKAACGSDSAKKELSTLGFAEEDASVVGCIVGLECVQVKTKANTDFTRYTWSPGTVD